MGKEEFEKTNQEMKDAAKRLVLYNKAEHYYFELIIMNEYEGRQNNKKKLSFLQKAIAEIKTENTDIKSPHVNYSLKALQIEYFPLKNDYEGARTLKIMTLIEMNKSDEAALAVNSLKQFFKYTEKSGTPISPRDKKILNLLLIAERKGFMFALLNGGTDKYMEALQGTNDEVRGAKDKDTIRTSYLDPRPLQWEPFTHEVIPFHEWFANKMPAPSGGGE